LEIIKTQLYPLICEEIVKSLGFTDDFPQKISQAEVLTFAWGAALKAS